MFLQAVPTSLHIIFAGIILVLSFFQYESPRYLVRSNKPDEAVSVLARLRGLPADHPHIQMEMHLIVSSHREESEATLGQGWVGIAKEILVVPKNRYRLFLAVIAQLLACWSGGGVITVYAVNFFALLGVTGQNEQLFATAIFGVVKLAAALICALFLVDIVSRAVSQRAGIYSRIMVRCFGSTTNNEKDWTKTLTSVGYLAPNYLRHLHRRLSHRRPHCHEPEVCVNTDAEERRDGCHRCYLYIRYRLGVRVEQRPVFADSRVLPAPDPRGLCLYRHDGAFCKSVWKLACPAEHASRWAGFDPRRHFLVIWGCHGSWRRLGLAMSP